MAKIVKEGKRQVSVSYVKSYDVFSPGWGYCFDCDAQGNVDISKLQPVAQENYQKALASGVAPRVECERNSWWDAAILKCDCGTKVSLDDPMTNECGKCGALYNSCGQSLRPRDQWEESWDESY